ncbi:MAG: sigma-70 family RNA polymerase sigma factor [Ignavibacteria bacterium]|nr:sigma-70 family RNA polymerase sigma factor [Ignavibacteriota bacterium]
MDNNNDLLLIKRISQKDETAFSQFYDIHHRYIYTIIFNILRDQAESEDLLQEIFIQIWNKVDSYDETLGNPLAWITRMTRNKSIDRLRSKGYKKRSAEIDMDKFFDLSGEPGADDPDAGIILSQEQSEVSKAIKSLKQNQRELIVLSYFRGFSQSELAEHFDIPLGTVKTRMRAAMMILRDKLKKYIQ